MKELNQRLELNTFLSGEQLGSEDLDIFEGFEKEPDVEKYPHLVRWWRHVKSLR